LLSVRCKDELAKHFWMAGFWHNLIAR
jgi:hypothetical protein